MEVTSLTALKQMIKASPAMVIDFWSPACPPCVQFKPKFENYAAKNTNPVLTFHTVNVKDYPHIGQEFGIKSIPTFGFYLNGKSQGNLVGANDESFRFKLDQLSRDSLKGTKPIGSGMQAQPQPIQAMPKPSQPVID